MFTPHFFDFVRGFYDKDVCLYFESFGQKAITFSKKYFELIRFICNIININVVPNLTVDFCKSLFYIPKYEFTYSTSIHYNSFLKFQNSIFSVLRAPEITNLNKKTIIVDKMNHLKIFQIGFYKFNVYSNFTRYLLPTELLKMKLPMNSTQMIKSNFFGYKCKVKKTVKN
jgi:hypothetical protein